MSCNYHSCNRPCNHVFKPVPQTNCCNDLYYLIAGLSASIASLSAAAISPAYGTFNNTATLTAASGAAVTLPNTSVASAGVATTGTTITVATAGVYEINYNTSALLTYVNTSTITPAPAVFTTLGVNVNGALSTISEKNASLSVAVSSVTAGSLLPVTITECVPISNSFQVQLPATSTLNLVAVSTLTTCGPVVFSVERIA